MMQRRVHAGESFFRPFQNDLIKRGGWYGSSTSCVNLNARSPMCSPTVGAGLGGMALGGGVGRTAPAGKAAMDAWGV